MTVGVRPRHRFHTTLLDFVRQERTALGSVFLSNVALGFAGLVSGFILARTLGPAGRGFLGSVQAAPVLISGFVLLGLHEAVVYYGIREPARRRTYLSGALLVTVMAAAVAAAVLVIVPIELLDRSWKL